MTEEASRGGRRLAQLRIFSGRDQTAAKGHKRAGVGALGSDGDIDVSALVLEADEKRRVSLEQERTNHDLGFEMMEGPTKEAATDPTSSVVARKEEKEDTETGNSLTGARKASDSSLSSWVPVEHPRHSGSVDDEEEA